MLYFGTRELGIVRGIVEPTGWGKHRYSTSIFHYRTFHHKSIDTHSISDLRGLAGKPTELSGRVPVRTTPRRSQAPAPQEANSRLLCGAAHPQPAWLPRPTRITARLRGLAGKPTELSGRMPVRTTPRRSQAPAPQEANSRLLCGAAHPQPAWLPRPTRITARLRGLAGKPTELSGRMPVRTTPRRSQAPVQWQVYLSP